MTLRPAALRDKLASVPVIESSLSLMTGTMATAGLGLIFWVLAARLYDPSHFGVSTTVVYTMMMLADVAGLGLRSGLVRYVPKAGSKTSAIVFWGYGLALVASALTALAFLAGVGWWAPDLIELRTSVPLFVFFVASTGFWALFMLEDSVLVGLRQSLWVPIENSLFGVLKIVLLFPLASLSPTLGIFWAWTLPVFPIVIVVNLLVVKMIRSRPDSEGDRSDGDRGDGELGDGDRGDGEPSPAGGATVASPARTRSLFADLLSFSIADWVASVSRLAALAIIPLMVLARLDGAEAGYFQASWLIAFTIFALSSNAAYALLAENSYEQAKLHRNSMQAGLLSLAITAPIIVVGVVGAPLLLRVYGADYAANSATVLRILLIAAIPNLILQIFIGRLRSQGRMLGVVVVETLLSILVVTLAWLFLPRYGINGVGLAWLLGLVTLAVYAAAIESLWWWASRLDTRFVRRVGAALRRLRSDRPARGMAARLRTVLETVDGPVDGSVAGVTWLPSGETLQTAVVALAGDRELVVEFARSQAGVAELARRRELIVGLEGHRSSGEMGHLLPELEGGPESDGADFLAYRQPTGPTALDLVRAGRPMDDVVALAVDAVRPLHEATARPEMIDETTVDRWIAEPVARLAVSGRATAGNVDQLRRFLLEGFVGRVMDIGRIHGELALDNIVMSEDPLQIVGLLWWEQSTEMPVIIDRATLALSELALGSRSELGAVVRSLLADPAPFDTHPALLGADTPLSPAVILLAWLHLVGRPLPPRRVMSSEAFWLARNARPVLASLAPVAAADR